MPKTVEFFFDVGSPASYLAWTQLPKLCAQSNARLVYKPMLLGGVFQETGNQSPALIPAKGRYLNIDFQRFALRYGVPFNMNPHFPINTLMLMRGATGVLLRKPERLNDYLTAVFGGIWIDGSNLNDPAVVGEILHKARFEASEVQAMVADPEVKQHLKDTTFEAVARGAFGAPTIYVGNQMFFGQDRLDFVREALQ